MFRRDPKRRSAAGRSGKPSERGTTRSRTTPEAAPGSAPDSDPLRFVLYVEGPRDREILAGWARHAAPLIGRELAYETVILGGRQPARAVVDFRRRGGAPAGFAGLVVLDRDDHRHPVANEARLLEPGLELFVWSLRHIESYLLVPAAIRRVAPHAPDERRLADWIASEVGTMSLADPSRAPRGGPHAKRLLGAGGALCESLGVELRPGEIAKAMRRDELHADVHDLFERIATLRGIDGRSGD